MRKKTKHIAPLVEVVINQHSPVFMDKKKQANKKICRKKVVF